MLLTLVGLAVGVAGEDCLVVDCTACSRYRPGGPCCSEPFSRPIVPRGPSSAEEEVEQYLQLLGARVAERDVAASAVAADADAAAESLAQPLERLGDDLVAGPVIAGVGVGGLRRGPPPGTHRLVVVHPALRVADRQVAAQHHLEAVLL